MSVLTTILFLLGFLSSLVAYHLADRRARHATERAEKAEAGANVLAGDLLAAQGAIRSLRSTNTALVADLDAAHLALLARSIRTTPIGVRRAGSSLVVLLSAEDVAFLRRDALALAQYLCDAVEPETEEQRAHRAILERRLDVQLRVIGDRS
jgi:hypothetical protein